MRLSIDPMHVYRSTRLDVFLACAIFVICGVPSARAASSVNIPRVSTPPRMEDFEDGAPVGNSTLARVTDFIQQQPSDGKPATQRTEVYLGYDESNLYMVWVCRDTD